MYYTEIVIRLTEIATNIKQFLKLRDTKKTSRGIYVKHEDFEELQKNYEILVSTINDGMPSLLEEHINIQNQLSTLQGKYSQVMNVLHLCYNDFKSHQRSDAISAIEQSLADV